MVQYIWITLLIVILLFIFFYNIPNIERYININAYNYFVTNIDEQLHVYDDATNYGTIFLNDANKLMFRQLCTEDSCKNGMRNMQDYEISDSGNSEDYCNLRSRLGSPCETGSGPVSGPVTETPQTTEPEVPETTETTETTEPETPQTTEPEVPDPCAGYNYSLTSYFSINNQWILLADDLNFSKRYYIHGRDFHQENRNNVQLGSCFYKLKYKPNLGIHNSTRIESSAISDEEATFHLFTNNSNVDVHMIIYDMYLLTVQFKSKDVFLNNFDNLYNTVDERMDESLSTFINFVQNPDSSLNFENFNIFDDAYTTTDDEPPIFFNEFIRDINNINISNINISNPIYFGIYPFIQDGTVSDNNEEIYRAKYTITNLESNKAYQIAFMLKDKTTNEFSPISFINFKTGVSCYIDKRVGANSVIQYARVCNCKFNGLNTDNTEDRNKYYIIGRNKSSGNVDTEYRYYDGNYGFCADDAVFYKLNYYFNSKSRLIDDIPSLVLSDSYVQINPSNRLFSLFFSLYEANEKQEIHDIKLIYMTFKKTNLLNQRFADNKDILDEYKAAFNNLLLYYFTLELIHINNRRDPSKFPSSTKTMLEIVFKGDKIANASELKSEFKNIELQYRGSSPDISYDPKYGMNKIYIDNDDLDLDPPTKRIEMQFDLNMINSCTTCEEYCMIFMLEYIQEDLENDSRSTSHTGVEIICFNWDTK